MAAGVGHLHAAERRALSYLFPGCECKSPSLIVIPVIDVRAPRLERTNVLIRSAGSERQQTDAASAV